MKAEELMIGDWVRIIDDDTDAFFDARVEGIDSLANIYATMPCDETEHPYSVDCAKPIPLTPEILEKNGFKEKNIFAETMGIEIFGDENNGCGISEWYDGDWAFETFTPWTEAAPDGSPEDWGFKTESRITKMKYVHELQHALRLCGIEKELEL